MVWALWICSSYPVVVSIGIAIAMYIRRAIANLRTVLGRIGFADEVALSQPGNL